MKLQSLISKLSESVLSEELLDEAAKDTTTLAREGYALYVKPTQRIIKFVLYKPEALFRRMKNETQENTGIVEAYIRCDFNSTCENWEVAFVAAEHGLGPTMYDIAMSYVNPAYVMADRMAVSSLARKIWRYMVTTRANDFNVKKLPFDCEFGDANQLGKPQELNYAFSLKNKVDFGMLETNHTAAMRMLRGHADTSKVEEYLARTGHSYFDLKYGNTPMAPGEHHSYEQF